MYQIFSYAQQLPICRKISAPADAMSFLWGRRATHSGCHADMLWQNGWRSVKWDAGPVEGQIQDYFTMYPQRERV